MTGASTAPPPPRVLIVAGMSGPGPVAGGVWTVAATQAAALREAGGAVTVLSGWIGAVPPSPDPRYRLRNLVPRSGLRGLASVRLLVAAVRLARVHDVVHVHLARDLITTPALLLIAALTRTPVAVQTHGMIGPADPGRLIRLHDRLFKRAVLRAPARWFALTEREAADLERYGVPADRIADLANASTDHGARWQDSPGARFVFASRLHPRKQPAVLVEAAALAAVDRPVLLFAGADQGSGADVRAAAEAAAPRGVEVRLLGALEPAAVRELLTGCTAMVLPSRDEPYPMIVLEAAALGVPIVVTAESGVSELLRMRDAAVVVPPDAASIAAALDRVATSPELRERLSRNARRAWEELWSPPTLRQRLLEQYGTLLARAGQSAGPRSRSK